mgnify:CR=1 FL=1
MRALVCCTCMECERVGPGALLRRLFVTAMFVTAIVN